MKETIVAVLGDYYHSREALQSTLEQSIQGLEGEYEISYLTVQELAGALADRPAAVIFSAENRVNPQDKEVRRWMDDGAATAIRNYVEDGGSWLGWHSGLASYDEVRDYVSLLRGQFKYHPKEHQTVTYTLNHNDLGIEDHHSFSVKDEHYFVECDESNTQVFLHSSSVDGDSIAGWYHSVGQGRVCCFTPAHTTEALQHPSMIAMLSQILKYLRSS
ncbi:ThuA domain-containing protein [Ammoniphilus sp. YIM 78166]|uniref:ThuA domain-containing protein n=1 Tax=Ammoniphilus sp. YIM 78166 TaxID=1644106 RepID=UPI00106F2A81|nr:ThuA domain-containing protein [Ammoniphilus sp. YIM 78166]